MHTWNADIQFIGYTKRYVQFPSDKLRYASLKKKQNKRIYISNTNKKEDTNMYSTKYYFFKKVEKMITEFF